MQDEVQIRKWLTQTKKEHSKLDETIIRLTQLGTHDQTHLRRLKKRKLQFKDQIAALNTNLITDDIALTFYIYNI